MGRLVSLAFSVLFVVSVAWLASRTASGYRRFAAALAVVVVLTIWYFDRYIAAGLTDIPVAAMIALTAALLCARRLGRAQLPLVGLAAALSVLTKPSALPALLGLGAAVLIGHRSDFRRRAFALAAIGLGTAAGLLYDLSQAHYVHMGLRSFLTVGTTGLTHSSPIRTESACCSTALGWGLTCASSSGSLSSTRSAARTSPIGLPTWSHYRSPRPGRELGPHLFGGAWSAGRDPRHRNAARRSRSPFSSSAASLLFAVESPAEAVPERLRLARLLAWALPTLVLWGATAVYDTRLLAPAWPPLVLLVV